MDICQSCGEPHDELSFSIPTRLPTAVFPIPQEERSDRVWSNGELCVIDDRSFFLYGSIELPIIGHSDAFSWGVWVELPEKTFFWYQDLLDSEGREVNESFPAVLATDIPFYEPTLGLTVSVKIQPLGYRPFFRVVSEHLLASEQSAGVEPSRIKEIRNWFEELRAENV